MTEDSHEPSQTVAKNAQKGLDLYYQFNRGGTDVGHHMAERLAKQDTFSDEEIIKISSYFARHAIDKNADNFGNSQDPSKGYIAWLLWGGDEGQAWADKIKKTLQPDD